MVPKLKIRKVEASIEEVILRIEELVELSERIPGPRYFGTNIKFIFTALGIKELEFWEIRYNNEELFDQKFRIVSSLEKWDDKRILRVAKYYELGYIDKKK